MTTLQRVGVALGLLVIVLRLPGAFWPEAYASRMERLLLAGPGVVRALGVFFLALAIVILVLIVKTLALLPAVMLVIAVLLAASGAVSVLFPDAYARLSVKMMGSLGPTGIRIAAIAGVAVGLWITYLSLTVQ